MLDHYGIAVVEMGIKPKDFWKLEVLEFFIFYRQHLRREKKFKMLIENSTRMAGWIPASMLGDGKKKIKPSDFVKFEWEGETKSKRTTCYTREEKERFIKAVKPEWLHLIDN